MRNAQYQVIHARSELEVKEKARQMGAKFFGVQPSTRGGWQATVETKEGKRHASRDY